MNRIVRHTPLAATLALALACHGVAWARDPSSASAAASEASAASAAVAGSVVVAGSLATLALAGSAVVTGVEAVAEGSVIVLRGLSGAASASIRVAGTASVAVGSVVEVVALATGCAVVQAGRTIAFVPNAIGRSLVHHRPLGAQ